MKWYCTVCGYVYEGPTAPEFCHSVKLLQANSKRL